MQHYWKCNESSGDLTDLVAGLDLVRTDTHVIGSDTYPAYGAAGPIAAFPSLTAVYSAGVGGGASTHDGVFSVAIPGTPDWTINGNPFTIELWIWLDEYPAAPGYAMQVGDGGSSVSFYLAGFGGTSLTSQIDTDLFIDPNPFPLDTWQHIAITSDGATGKLYRGGVLVDSGAATDAPGSGTVNLLNQGGGSEDPWPGRTAHLAIYDCELTQTDLQEHIANAASVPDVTAGYVWTADGTGGTSWEAPTIEVTY